MLGATFSSFALIFIKGNIACQKSGKCICKKYQTNNILCSHINKISMPWQVSLIPPTYLKSDHMVKRKWKRLNLKFKKLCLYESFD